MYAVKIKIFSNYEMKKWTVTKYALKNFLARLHTVFYHAY